MNILIAPDSFKDSLSAKDVAFYLKKGIRKVWNDAKFDLAPIADGGEGTVETILTSVKGRIVQTKVHDPLMRDIDSFFGITDDGSTAIIEMAAASGLELLKPEERNPWITTSFGTGELIKKALDNQCKTIILGIGGSATNDAGVGMAMALGVKFLDENNQSIPVGGGELRKISTIDMSGADRRLQSTTILVACDVTNPLTGTTGASVVYGPQKGADSEMVKKLDENLSFFARLVKEQLGKDVDSIPGAGAAGGMGAGLVAFLGAHLRKGFDIVAAIANLEQKIAASDLVITGEGKADHQSLHGKATFGVAQLAQKYNKPVVLFTGNIGTDAEALYESGVHAILSIIDKPMSTDEALVATSSLLEKAGERMARVMNISTRLGNDRV
jgi:glycerate kinase